MFRSSDLDLYLGSLPRISSLQHSQLIALCRNLLEAYVLTYSSRNSSSAEVSEPNFFEIMEIQMIRATYASQDNLERFLAGIFGEGKAEVSVSAP